MSVDFEKAQEIFLDAVELTDAGARDRLLDQACGDDHELRRHVEVLLRAHAQSGSFLERGALATNATIDLPIVETAGMQLGPYKLLQQIGEGGMGIVYMAEQAEPVERRVALKIIKPGMDTRQVIARFEAERQALAMMDHPNIAKVLDAGATESGRPYFVMELVKGVPITQYCDERHLTPKQRLELFVSVCQGAQHAHQKGIIHRDIKPSNVLVTEYDEPVEACPPSTAYRFRKFVRRNRVTFVTAAMLATALLVGLIGTSWQAIRATIAEAQTRQARQTVEQQRDRAVQAETRAKKEAQSAREAAARERDAADRERAARRDAQRNVYLTRMNLLQQSYEDGDGTRVHELLQAQIPGHGSDPADDFRGFEWSYWWWRTHRFTSEWKISSGSMARVRRCFRERMPPRRPRRVARRRGIVLLFKP